jgi:uncharacterized membrane protein
MSELVAIAYPDHQVAQVVRGILVELSEQGLIELDDAVVASRDRKGKLKLEQSLHPSRSRAAGGALAGAVVGLLVAAPLLGAAVGAASGAAVAPRDVGVDDDFARQLAAALEPPRAALVLLVRAATADKVLPEIQEYGGQVIRTSLSDEIESALRARLGEPASTPSHHPGG